MQSSNLTFLKIRAWFVHFYTSLGLVVGLLAIIQIMLGDVKWAFLLLGLAVFIDATDGTLARAWKVKIYAASFDGRKLDDITDYLNYAFIPVIFIYKFQLVPTQMIWVLGVVLITAVYGFCQNVAKTDDGYFTGFPNFWNFIAFYMYLLKLSPVINGIILLIFSLLIFVPVKYLSFSTKPFKKHLFIISGVYSILLLWITLKLEQPDMTLVYLSLLFPIGYAMVSIYMTMLSTTKRVAK
ncbi:MAG TPA: CDP-alcohol phosphatidyltransferase family protein [Anaerolineaceae bacterium]